MAKFGIVLKSLLLCYTSISLTRAASFDPYEVLDVSRSASTQDIRRAFKHLAKQWHPDKNSDPEAELNFIRIKQAYELLSDSERRRIYDDHGITNEDSVLYKQKHDYSQYDRFTADNLDMFFGRKFQSDRDSNFYHKISITTKYFDRTIRTENIFTPYIFFLYNDWNLKCTLATGAFQKTLETLEPLGIRFASINVAIEQELYRKTGASDVPTLVLLVDGHFYKYRRNVYPVTRVVEFIREKIPYSVTVRLTDETVQKFLDSWKDNRVRLLLFEPRNQTRLRYLLLAYKFRHRVAFGLLDTSKEECTATMKTYQIQSNLDTMLLFYENSEKVVASISLNQIPVEKMVNIILQHQYLTLPRLSSQEIFEAICPAEWNRTRKRLCVVLITLNSDEHNFAREVFRNISNENHFHTEKVRFVYIYQKEQVKFLNAISNNSPNSKLLQIAVLWRRDSKHLNYEWIEDFRLPLYIAGDQRPDAILNNTKFIIYKKIQKLLHHSEILTNEALIEDLVNEHSQGIVHLWLRNIFYIYQYTIDKISEEQLLAIFSLLGTIVFMVTVGYIILYFVHFEEDGGTAKNIQLLNNKQQKSPELKLHELRAEKYNGMVRLLKPGCRTIILITDLPSRSKLIPPFHKAAWAYRKSKTLLFGHMLIEKGLSWYSELLRISLFKSDSLHINPRNCVGTVLAINGHRKYFCMYHAKHPETRKATKRIRSITKDLEQYGDIESGVKYESDDLEFSDNEPQIITEDNLLDGLSNWLDRLFEGTTQRYYVNYWPEFCKK